MLRGANWEAAPFHNADVLHALCDRGNDRGCRVHRHAEKTDRQTDRQTVTDVEALAHVLMSFEPKFNGVQEQQKSNLIPREKKNMF